MRIPRGISQLLVFKARLWFLRRAQQDFAGEGPRRLRHDHRHGVCDVGALQHLVGVFPLMRAEFGVG